VNGTGSGSRPLLGLLIQVLKFCVKLQKSKCISLRYFTSLPIPVAPLSKAICRRSLTEIVGSNPAGAWTSVSCKSCVSPSTGLCVGLITCSGVLTESGVSEYDREASIMRRSWSTMDCCAIQKKIHHYLTHYIVPRGPR